MNYRVVGKSFSNKEAMECCFAGVSHVPGLNACATPQGGGVRLCIFLARAQGNPVFVGSWDTPRVRLLAEELSGRLPTRGDEETSFADGGIPLPDALTGPHHRLE